MAFIFFVAVYPCFFTSCVPSCRIPSCALSCLRNARASSWLSWTYTSTSRSFRPRQSTTRQQSHFRKAKALRVGRPLLSFIGPGIPDMRAQNERRRAAAFGLRFACFADTGGFKFMPCARADARPFAFRPPFGSLPSLRCHAGDLATTRRPRVVNQIGIRTASLFGASHRSLLLLRRQTLRLLAWVLRIPKRFLLTCHASSSLPYQPHSKR